MIKQEDINQISNLDSIERIYEELMLNGIDAVPAQTKEIRSRVFSKICHDLIQQYISWNDYIHSNNIMQLFKSVAFSSTSSTKSGWFIRYEIIIYGRRTPLYFIENPSALFEKIITACGQNKAEQLERLAAAVESLFNYYKNNFLSATVATEDKELFVSRFQSVFIKEYHRCDRTRFPQSVQDVFDDFTAYVENPGKYVEPGITHEEFVLWDEDEDSIVVKEAATGINTHAPAGKYFEKKEPQQVLKVVDVPDLPDAELRFLRGKTIRFIGALNKPSIKNKLHGISKQYGFTIEMFDDYEKIANMDFSKMRYSNRINGIIAGPMPHKIKGMGNYSSGLEMLRSEPGYPPVFECIAGDKLKITTTSLWHALRELNKELASI